MDDPAWVWPAWKFGMKRDDLFTTLHDRYNTFSYTLQDPEAFHHDVYELSHVADTAQDFHRFMADRQRQRIAELQESLESLAVEIIANPKLMGSDQWQHALQLFRTKSFDSIVRYFASYLPDEFLDRRGPESVASSRSSYSETDSVTTAATSADGASSPFLDGFFPDRVSIITDEPCPLDPNDDFSLAYDAKAPCPSTSDSLATPSPRSTPFPDTESLRLCTSFARRSAVDVGYDDEDDDDDDNETCQSDGGDMTPLSLCDSTDAQSLCESAASENPCGIKREFSLHIVDGDKMEDRCMEHIVDDDDDYFPAAQHPEDDFCSIDFTDGFLPYDTLDSDTPTPKQPHPAPIQLLEPSKPTASGALPSSLSPPLSLSRSLSCRRRRSPSPRSHLGHHQLAAMQQHHAHDTRRSPEEAFSRIQKPVLPDPFGRRPRASGARRRRSCLSSSSSTTSSSSSSRRRD